MYSRWTKPTVAKGKLQLALFTWLGVQTFISHSQSLMKTVHTVFLFSFMKYAKGKTIKTNQTKATYKQLSPALYTVKPANNYNNHHKKIKYQLHTAVSVYVRKSQCPKGIIQKVCVLAWREFPPHHHHLTFSALKLSRPQLKQMRKKKKRFKGDH